MAGSGGVYTMAKILFLNPPLDFTRQYKHLAEAGSELPPLGIALLAAVARKHGHEVVLIDALALGLDEDALVEHILAAAPDIVGMTATSLAIFPAAAIAQRLKQARPGLKILIGGPHLTSVPQETMQRFPAFDIGVVGEAEVTLIELLAALTRQEGNLDAINGLVYRLNGALRTTPARALIQDLDSLPYPAWDLLPDLRQYYQPAADSLYRFPATLLITSRGCPGRCVFCDRSVFGNTLRAYSAEYCMGMIQQLITHYGIRDIFFEDDNFLAFRTRTIELCNLLIAQRLDLTFSIMGRVDMVTPELLALLKRAGCWQINYGLESGSQRILDIIGKGTTVEAAEQALRMSHAAGIKVKGLFMVGNPGEDRQSIKETCAFIRRMPIDDFHMTFFTPFPGSEVAGWAATYGAFNPDWNALNMFTPGTFIPFGFTAGELARFHRQAYRIFYLRPRIIWYYLRKLRHPRMIKKLWKAMVAFIRFLLVRS